MGRRGSLTRAALGLAGGNMATRVLGMVYRVLLTRLMGPKGMGLLQLALAAYGAVLAPFISGLPPGIARVAARMDDPGAPAARRLLIRLAAAAAALASLAAAALVFFIPHLTSETWQLARAHINFALFAPVMVLAVLCSLLRGLFLGLQRIGPVIASQVAEQSVRSGILALSLLLLLQSHWGLAERLTLVVWNLAFGELTSLLVLSWWYRRLLNGLWVLPRAPGGGRPLPDDTWSSPLGIGSVVKVAGPVALQRSIGSITHLVEASAIPALLALGGLKPAQAFAFYGEYGGMAIPLIYLPTVFVYAMTAVLLPAMADGSALARTRRRARQALILAAHCGAGMGLALYLGGDVAVRMLFGNAAAGGEAYPYAGQLAILLAAVPFFFYIDAVAATILRGLAQATGPLVTDLVSAAVRLSLLFVLVPRPEVAGLGVTTAVTAGIAAACIMDLAFASRAVGLGVRDLGPLLHAALALPPAAMAGRALLGGHWARAADPAVSLWQLLPPLAVALIGAGTMYAITVTMLKITVGGLGDGRPRQQ